MRINALFLYDFFENVNTNLRKRVFMQTTGIVRRVDELGRIVVPKEIRNNLRIKKGDCLEFFLDDGKIILTKHDVFDKINSVQTLIDIVSKHLGVEILITDNSKVLYSGGANSKLFKEKDLEKKVYDMILIRKEILNKEEENKIFNQYFNYIVSPLIINGDVIGSIIVLKDEKGIKSEDKLAVDIIRKLLINNLEV